MNDREQLILKAVIKHYLDFGESVGSRTIEKKYDIGISSATIRNAMADLEDKGLISKTHTSSGRIPTCEGYKVYVDNILNEEFIDYSKNIDVNSYVKLKSEQVGNIIENVTQMLSKLSGNTTASLEPSNENHKLKKVELIFIDSKRAFVVAVTDMNIIKTANLQLYNYIDEVILKKVSSYINEMILDKNEEYTLTHLKTFLEKIGELNNGLSHENNTKLHISNETSLLLNSNDVFETIRILEDKADIKNLLKDIVNEKEYTPYEVNVLFGDETNNPKFKDFTFLFSIYEYAGERGILCIIGPYRMNYKKNINLLCYINEILKQALNKTVSLKLLS